MASSRRFEDLKDELIAKKEEIRIHLRRNANEMIISKLFIDGDTLLANIKNEVDRCPASVQAEMNARLFAVRNEWNAFKKTAHRPAILTGGLLPSSSSSSSNFGNSSLGPGGMGPSSGMTRTAILNQGIDALQSTGVSLQRAEMVARESEEIGTNVLDELGTQRETLLRSRARIDDTNVDLKKSHRLIRMINTHAATNKCLLISIIAIEIMILVAIVYLRFIRK